MRHVYVHVPFCRRRCSYCDFAIAVRRSVPAAAYVDAIRRELALERATSGWDVEPPVTLYFGGGTPSLLAPHHVAQLVRCFSPHTAELREGAMEVTLEANPDDVDPLSAAAWRAGGINRISLGVQSFDPRVLEWMHRTHAPDRPAEAVRVLRRAGFDNLSLDLIFALPDAVRPEFARTLDLALALEPEHLSVYGLSVEPRTPLARWISRGALTPTPDERYAEEFLLAHETLTRAGYQHYEVSNYARPGRQSRHNSAYWTGAPYAGLGPSAHSFADGVRRWNVPQWVAYRRELVAGRAPEGGRERLTAAQQRLEAVYLSLRTVTGISHHQLNAEAGPVVARALEQGLLTQTQDRLVATPRGWLALEALVDRLTTWAEGG